MICKNADNCSKYMDNYGNPYPHQSPCEYCVDYQEPELVREASKILYQMYQDELNETLNFKLRYFDGVRYEEKLKQENDSKLKKFKSLLMNLDDMC